MGICWSLFCLKIPQLYKVRHFTSYSYFHNSSWQDTILGGRKAFSFEENVRAYLAICLLRYIAVIYSTVYVSARVQLYTRTYCQIPIFITITPWQADLHVLPCLILLRCSPIDGSMVSMIPLETISNVHLNTSFRTPIRLHVLVGLMLTGPTLQTILHLCIPKKDLAKLHF